MAAWGSDVRQSSRQTRRFGGVGGCQQHSAHHWPVVWPKAFATWPAQSNALFNPSPSWPSVAVCTVTNSKLIFLSSGVAQWLARWAHNPKVPGSTPGSAISVHANLVSGIREVDAVQLLHISSLVNALRRAETCGQHECELTDCTLAGSTNDSSQGTYTALRCASVGVPTLSCTN